MKKYIYSPHHIGLVLAPKNSWWLKDTHEIKAYMEECKFLYDNPEKHTMPTHRLQAKEWEAYNNWKASLITVPAEYLDCFEDGKEYPESAFETKRQFKSSTIDGAKEIWCDCTNPTNFYLHNLFELRLVAIPLQSQTGAIEDITKYNSPYESVVTYRCDKNFTVRLKAMINKAMAEAGYCTHGERFDRLIKSFDNIEAYLFESIDIKNSGNINEFPRESTTTRRFSH